MKTWGKKKNPRKQEELKSNCNRAKHAPACRNPVLCCRSLKKQVFTFVRRKEEEKNARGLLLLLISECMFMKSGATKGE